MTDSLSPDARAVLDAVISVAESPDAEAIAAAALRAAVDRIDDAWDGSEIVDYLCDLANELDPPSS